MGYEIEVDTAKLYANMLLSKPVDRNAKRFGTYKEAISKIKRELKEPIIQKKVRKMIDTLDKKYGGETSDATASIGTSEQIGAKSSKDGEQTKEKNKMSKTKPKGIASSKLTTYMKEKESDTPTYSQGKGEPVGVTYARKKKNERTVDTKAKTKPKKDEKEADNSDTQSDKIVKEVRRSVEDIVGDVGSDIPNLTKDAKPPVEQKSIVETIDIGDTSAKGIVQTKHPREDEVTIEEIPYEERPQKNLVTINIPTTNPTDNEPHLPKKGVEEETPKVIDSSIPVVDEAEKKETKKKKTERKET
ncbi:uncharacterized protein LOC131874915 [Cryptomeria japonica]|uniref:uncharacterized protein LOC131874915 n=1 Tax=Cryptomeria japonica TaxID=3369 RepID=UPI0027DAB002|nr:uncharacterized protein LOC131874915 [Cryptomeria japonica]